jgi:hypothetical protein
MRRGPEWPLPAAPLADYRFLSHQSESKTDVGMDRQLAVLREYDRKEKALKHVSDNRLNLLSKSGAAEDYRNDLPTASDCANCQKKFQEQFSLSF